MKDYESVFIILGISSIVLFLVSAIVIPLVIAVLPRDYFTRPIKPLRELNPFRIFLRILKNLIGGIFLLSGFLLLFIPGQGILTILLGLSLVDFPGKQHIQIRILKTNRVQKLVQWCRKKSGREPLLIPDR